MPVESDFKVNYLHRAMAVLCEARNEAPTMELEDELNALTLELESIITKAE